MCGTDPEIFLYQRTIFPETLSFHFKDVIQPLWMSSTLRLDPMDGTRMLTFT